ncbi:MAG: preprotein translocase subunit YajC [Bradyrhizobium sp.]|uniref:preprotein translocase subunit YajC n=1 Tax=Bradyrhizobium sp. TaxID=376 RepID=UPI001DF63FED|nr:preprotein translocase subunit YajC [Bradyrhizobium sp.]MBV9565728.1 preprotein translocase subunit YajC [Bradyrhizobium sp.]
MFESPAFAQATNSSAAGAGPPAWVTFLPWLAILVIFYILMIRPQQKRVKQHQTMLGAVKPRDIAVTSGGLIGKVTKVDENEVELEVAQGVRVRVVKSMLSDVRPHGAKAAND